MASGLQIHSFSCLALAAACQARPRLREAWANAWEAGTPARLTPWAGEPPMRQLKGQLPGSNLARGIYEACRWRPSSTPGWLGAFWISACQAPEAGWPRSSSAMGAFQAWRQLCESSSMAPSWSAHGVETQIPKWFAMGIGQSESPAECLAMMDGIPMGGMKRSEGFAIDFSCSFADLALASLLEPFLPWEGAQGGQKSRLGSNLSQAASLLIAAGATPQGCASAIAESAQLAFCFFEGTQGQRIEWRQAARAAFGAEAPRFREALTLEGAPEAAEALGDTLNEKEAQALWRSLGAEDAPQKEGGSKTL